MTARRVRIRRSRRADLPAVAVLVQQAWSGAYAGIVAEEVLRRRTPRYFARRFSLDIRSGLVLEADRRIIGFCLARAGRIEDLWIAPDQQNKGYGRALMRAGLTLLRRAGHSVAMLDCLVRNEGARRFYERHGWALLRTYKRPTALGPDIPVAVYWMDLGARDEPRAGRV